ncbi:hypothetical protein [Comamonas thiooxydans]|uniref:RipA family octameric membrane protein n=1 Tax=Comamonas thiooxydans TaxID=363952 RepID=UPI0005101C53|nr:hypothetical protein [Comamonas thiooxydans]KGG82640.1 hypothetical protein P609_19660 [Comamonas thiooxydans]
MEEEKISVHQLLMTQSHIQLEKLSFESEQQVQRNNFYMIFQGVVIAGFINTIEKLDGHIFSVMVAALVFFLTLYQIKTAAVSARIIVQMGEVYDRLEKRSRYLFEKHGVLDFPPSKMSDEELQKYISTEFSTKGESCFKSELNSLLVNTVNRNKYVSILNVYVAFGFSIFWCFVLVWEFYKLMK